MIDRKLDGPAPRTAMPKGATDTQMHMYLPGFEMRPDGVGAPADPLPDPAMYRRVMGWLGLDRVVITQGNAHGDDNASLLACVAEMGDCARGVAVIRPDTPDAEIARLSEGGIVGARIMNLPGGAVGLDDLEAIDAIAADAGWMMAVQFDGSALPDAYLRKDFSKINAREQPSTARFWAAAVDDDDSRDRRLTLGCHYLRHHRRS